MVSEVDLKPVSLSAWFEREQFNAVHFQFVYIYDFDRVWDPISS